MSAQLVFGTEDYGTENCGTEDYGTENCGTEDYATEDYATEDGTEDYATEDGTEDYATEDGTEDYATEDYGTENYGTEDYATEDYGTESYGRGTLDSLEQFTDPQSQDEQLIQSEPDTLAFNQGEPLGTSSFTSNYPLQSSVAPETNPEDTLSNIIGVLPSDVQQQLAPQIELLRQPSPLPQEPQFAPPLTVGQLLPEESVSNFGGTGMSISELAQGFTLGNRIISPKASPFFRNFNQQVLQANAANLNPSLTGIEKTQNLLNLVPQALEGIDQIVPNVGGRQVVQLRPAEVRAQSFLNFAFPSVAQELENIKPTLPERSQKILELSKIGTSQLIPSELKSTSGTPQQIIDSGKFETPLVLPPKEPFIINGGESNKPARSQLGLKNSLCFDSKGQLKVTTVIPLAGCPAPA